MADLDDLFSCFDANVDSTVTSNPVVSEPAVLVPAAQADALDTKSADIVEYVAHVQ